MELRQHMGVDDLLEHVEATEEVAARVEQPLSDSEPSECVSPKL